MHHHACPTCLGMSIHNVDDLSDTIFTNKRIWIEQQDILTTRLTDSYIVGFGKALIMIALYQSDCISKTTFQIVNRTISGMIVNHIDLRLEALYGSLHTINTLFQVITDVIVDDDDR